MVWIPPDYVPAVALIRLEQIVGRINREPILAHFLDPRGAPRRSRDPRRAAGDRSSGHGRRAPRAAAPRRDARRGGAGVDVVRVRDGRACVVAEAATVVAGEFADGSLQTDSRKAPPFAAVHVAVKRDLAGPISSLSPDEITLWTRNVIDAAPTPDLPTCGPPAGTVAHTDDLATRTAPNGAARGRALARPQRLRRRADASGGRRHPRPPGPDRGISARPPRGRNLGDGRRRARDPRRVGRLHARRRRGLVPQRTRPLGAPCRSSRAPGLPPSTTGGSQKRALRGGRLVGSRKGG